MVKCKVCGGTGTDPQSYPDTDCEECECTGEGFLECK